MQHVRQALDSLGAARPAVLRKDFLIDEYQVRAVPCNLGSRLIGALVDLRGAVVWCGHVPAHCGDIVR